jgi:2-polyprenyl-3-methyl-5-hydroxy-6-metoxy-1,4-benzoquinol methylase
VLQGNAIQPRRWSEMANGGNYYRFIRHEISPLLPKTSARILEVGAGAGVTLKWLKTIYPRSETTAVEVNHGLLDELRINADIAINARIEDAFPQLSRYDLILLLDVLEHLPDSSDALRKLTSLLTPGGSVIVSVPNIAHLSVSIPLLLRRRFEYQDAGILDRTHTRFFVEDTAVKLLNGANLFVTDGLISGLQGPKTKLLDVLSCGFLRHHLVKQYIMAGQLSDGPITQQKIHWKIAP